MSEPKKSALTNGRSRKSSWLSIAGVVLLSLLCLWVLWGAALATDLGAGDFSGYWSAAYLLRTGNNPYDPQSMFQVQQTEIRSTVDFVVMAWNPPTLLVFLLPLAALSFTKAKAVMLVLNITILLSVCVLLAKLYLPQNRKAVLVFTLFVAIFPQVLVGITSGQVTFFVLLGMVLAIFSIEKGYWFCAGVFLILTTFKPQLVVLSTPYLFLYMASRQKLQGWLGFLLGINLLFLVLYFLRPEFLRDYVGMFSIAPINWAVPTLGGLFSYFGFPEFLRYSIFLLIPLSWKYSRLTSTIDARTGVAILTAVTLLTSFYGWSYDQSLLLIPIAQIFGWAFTFINKHIRYSLVGVGIIALLVNWLQRIIVTTEMFYVWIPVLVAIIYGICFYVAQKQRKQGIVEPAI